MSDRHAALLLLTGHLPHLHVPALGTVERSSWWCHVCHSFSNISAKTQSTLFRQSYPDIILWLSLSSATVHLAGFLNFLFCSFSHSRSEGWPHHGRTFSIYLYPLSFWLTLPRGFMSTSWCCPSRPCVTFLACVRLALFLALSLSPGNSLVSSWCDHTMLASLLWRCLTVPSLLQLCHEPTRLFSFCPRNPQNLSQSFHLKGVKTCFFILSECPAFTAVRCYRPQRFH